MKASGKGSGDGLQQKLDTAIGLLQHLLAIELAREGVPKQAHRKASSRGDGNGCPNVERCEA